MTATLADALADTRAGYWGSGPGEGEVDVHVVRNGDLSADHGVLWERCPVRSFSAEEYARSGIGPGDVLVTTSGDCGKVAIVRAVPANRFCASNFVRILRVRSHVEPRYLFWWLQSDVAAHGMTPFIRGTTLKNLAFAKFAESTAFEPPSLDAQRRVADILDKADLIRRQRAAAMALTEELLRSAFFNSLGPGSPGYVSWPERAIESLAADVPNAMRTGPFGSDLRHSEFVDEGIAVLGIDNAVQNVFAWGERRFITPEKYERLRRYTVHPGDVIVTIMGTTGRSAVVPDDIPVAITTKHLATITLDRRLAEPEFVSQSLHRHPDVLRQIGAANRGAIMSGLNLGLIKSLRVRVPPVERQREFAELTRRVRGMAAKMNAGGDAQVLFDSLVARAFSGQLQGDGTRPC